MRMYAINQMKYPHVLLCGTVISLLAASCAYAVESPVTPGPSVGHRPVTTGLVLGTGKGDMTVNTTNLNVGETIGLVAVSGNDADDDTVKAGANCVWYRVDPNTNAETVAKDPGGADRNCHYTLQAADVGFKIKNVIKIFSDQDIATAKGFTINPIDSWPVESVSANEVESAVLPFPATTTLYTHKSPHSFALSSAFPESGFIYAEFTIQVEGNANNNSQYDWSTDQPTWTSVDVNGIVKFIAKPSSATKTVLIRATSKTDKSVVYGRSFSINSWFTDSGLPLVNYAAAAAKCSLPQRWAASREVGGVINYDYGANVPSTTRGSLSGAMYSDWGWARNYPQLPNSSASSSGEYWMADSAAIKPVISGWPRYFLYNNTYQFQETRPGMLFGVVCVENI